MDRPSLHLSVVHLDDQAARTAWLVDHLAELSGSGIIYTLTIDAAKELVTVLSEHGYRVAAYTGRTDAAEREELEADLLDNRVKALVATSALGMGFDKPDLGFVVHMGAPASPISYYQHIGRAGRATARADAILLPGSEDRVIWDYFGSLAFPREEVVRQVLDALSVDQAQRLKTLMTKVELRRNRLLMVLGVLEVDGVVARGRNGWISTGATWSYDAQRYEGLEAAREAEQQAMIDYQHTDGCRMEFLRRQLDAPDLTDGPNRCGRCDNCTTG